MRYVVHECAGYMDGDAEDFYYHGYDRQVRDAEDVVCGAEDEDLAAAGLVELNFDE